MFLEEAITGHLVEILDLHELLDPNIHRITGRYNAGEEAQEPEPFDKARLVFPSGEPLPRCWRDPNYRATRRRR